MTIEAFLILAAIFGGVLGGYRLLQQVSSLDRRLRELEATEAMRYKILADAQGRERSHHSYSTVHGLEDAMALLIEHAMNLDAELARSQTALAILRQVRRSPYAYDDKKSGEEK